MARQNCAFVYTIHLQSLQVYQTVSLQRDHWLDAKKIRRSKFLKEMELKYRF